MINYDLTFVYSKQNQAKQNYYDLTFVYSKSLW